MKFTDALLHITESLTNNQRIHLIKYLSDTAGINSADFSRAHSNILKVNYDPQKLSATSIWHAITASGLHSKLLAI